MKLTGITGTGSGKMGNAVFSVNAGQQVVRQYQPVVTNPSTRAQVDNRARLKLLSQLSAVMADVIAIPRAGALTPRNQYVSINFPATSASNGVAQANLAELSLTKGGTQIPSVVAARVDGTAIDVNLASKADQIVTRVVYIAFYRNAQRELQLLDSAIVEDAGANGTFPYAFPFENRDVIVYAYGIFDKSSKATAKFGNYEVTTGTQLASLIADRKISESDYLLSKTRGVLLAGETHIEVTSVTCNTVNVPASGQVSVPYDQSVSLEVNAVDVEGKVLAALVDGQVGEMRAFDASGYAFVGVFDLVGGENVRAQIGHTENGLFVAEFTYGGTAVIGQQATAISSVVVNETAVASTGVTPIEENVETYVQISSTGAIGKYMRVTVNGVARTPIALTNGQGTDRIMNLQVGDSVTFQVGRVVNGTFVQDAAYGGSVAIVDVTPTFDFVKVNSNNVPATGQVSILMQTPNTIQAQITDGNGKYFAVLGANDAILAIGQIVNNGVSLSHTAAENDIIRFAVGNGATAQEFSPLATFGGSVKFVATQPSEISNAMVDNQAWNNNITIYAPSFDVTAETTLSGADYTHAIMATGSSKPAIDTVFTPGNNQWGNVAAIADGQISYNFSPGNGEKCWMGICKSVGNGQYQLTYVYDYYVETAGF